MTANTYPQGSSFIDIRWNFRLEIGKQKTFLSGTLLQNVQFYIFLFNLVNDTYNYLYLYINRVCYSVNTGMTEISSVSKLVLTHRQQNALIDQKRSRCTKTIVRLILYLMVGKYFFMLEKKTLEIIHVTFFLYIQTCIIIKIRNLIYL